MLAVVQHHLPEGQVVVDRRREFVGEDGRARPQAAARFVEDREPAGRGVGLVARCQPVGFAAGTLKPVSFMPSGAKRRSGEERLQRLADACASSTFSTSKPV